MTTENLKNWLKIMSDVGDGIYCGMIDGNKERCIGVYTASNGNMRVCLGGEDQTRTKTSAYKLLIHWTRDAVAAEQKAQSVYNLLYAYDGGLMDNCSVYAVDPGGGPVPVGRDEKGINEYVIELKITHERV